jgi:hypothetical protein
MKVVNHTNYDTRTLRGIFAAVHAKSGRKPHPRWKHVVVTVVYSRRGSISGKAWYNGTGIHCRLSRGTVSARDVAALFLHELLHSLGYHHGQGGLRSCGLGNQLREVAAFIPETTLEEVKPAAKSKPTLDDKRSAKLAAIQTRIAKWESKLRRAEKALAKLKRAREGARHPAPGAPQHGGGGRVLMKHSLSELRHNGERERAESAWTACCSCGWQETCRRKSDARFEYREHRRATREAERGRTVVHFGSIAIDFTPPKDES